MNYRNRALYYLVETGHALGMLPLQEMIARGFTPALLADYSNRQATFSMSAEQCIAQAAMDHAEQTHCLIPVDTLVARTDQRFPVEYKEQARALELGLKSQVGDGSDVAEVCDGLLREHKRRLQHQMVVRLNENVFPEGGDPAAGVEIIKDLLAQIDGLGGVSDQQVFSLGGTAADAMIEYQQRELDDSAGLGIPTGLLPFDAHTGGIQRGEVAAVIGRTKGGKSTLCGIVAANAFMLGASVACAGKEMAASFLRRRIEAGLLLAECDGRSVHRQRAIVQGGAARALETGSLPPELKQRYLLLQEMFQQEAERGHNFWMLEPGSYTTLDDLAVQCRRIAQRGPLDLLWVDSLNIQSKRGRSEREDLRQGEMVELLRATALELNVAVLVDIQEKAATWTKRYAGLDEVVGFSNSISHRIDHMWSIYSPPGHEHLKEIQPLAARNTQLVDFFAMYYWPDAMVMECAPAGSLNDAMARRQDQSASSTVAAAMGGFADPNKDL